MISIDVVRARRETRGCERVVHFNNAGSSLMPTVVRDGLRDFLDKEELTGGYEVARDEASALENFYVAASRLLGCAPHEIAFAENATRAWSLAFYSFRFAPGDRILTTYAEYGSNVIAFIQQARRYGVDIVFVPNDASGQIDVNALATLIDEKTKLIAISHIPTGGGLVNPAAAVGKIANAANVPFLLDACQAVGQIPLDVKSIGCDMLSGTGRKYLRGPRGTGLLYVKESLCATLEPPILDQHAADLISATEMVIRPDAKRFETWEQFFAGKAALGIAIDYALAFGLDAIQHRVYELATALRSALRTIAGVIVTDEGAEQCGIVTFSTARLSSYEVQASLTVLGINVSVSDGSGNLVSFQQRGIDTVVRASLHYYNTETEIEFFIDSLTGVLERGMPPEASQFLK